MLKVTFLRKDKTAGLTVRAERFEFRGIQLLAHVGGDVNMVAWAALSGDWVGCDDREYPDFVIEEA